MAAEGEWPPLVKDFYLQCPEPSVQTAEFCWGNLEAAHAVLGPRTLAEVEGFREASGISVHAVRGRPPPKPFQSFSETAFPPFVEELAYELFSKDAVPFPVQAQAWPCALAGMDVTAVAPTGSGKTLAYLLPALVHIMSQEPLQRGDGPIALVLEPTSELAQQTLAVAARFFERTQDDDKLRAGAVYGGVDVSMQLPREDEPDFRRWPELLVATPARLLELLSKRRCLSPRRVSYLVLDEADELLSARAWLPQVEKILSYVRPDRQLLLFSATWPREADAVALQLCGEELVQVRVNPAVPPIPQEVRLFPGRAGDAYCQAERQEALAAWLRRDLRPGEVALVFCHDARTAAELADSVAIQAATQGPVVLFSGGIEARRHAYWELVAGKVRVLVAPYRVGGRGLDYADTASGKGTTMTPLSLAVVLFDFPATIGEYAHYIGRAMRPGQASGRAVGFIPEFRFWICGELSALMEHCGQPVPQVLRAQIAEDQQFEAECREAMRRLRAGSDPCGEWAHAGEAEAGAAAGACGGDFDEGRGLWRLPAALPSYRRKLLHWLSDEMCLAHVSFGDGPGRRLHVARDRRALPEKFFLEGEQVVVRKKGSQVSSWAVIVDPKVKRHRRTVRVRVSGGGRLEHDVSVDDVDAEPWPGAEPGGDAAAD